MIAWSIFYSQTHKKQQTALILTFKFVGRVERVIQSFFIMQNFWNIKNGCIFQIICSICKKIKSILLDVGSSK